jgi:aryl-alcohol dehydrogenase-like predicted oxidoreductase
LPRRVYGRMRPGPNGAGLSRKAIFAEIDNSLRRLGMDYVDLYQIHRFDHDTPVEETLEALHDVVKAGKARHLGASSMHAWQFARALGIAEKKGWTRFVSMQNLVNLLYREEEREMLPLCEAEGIGVIPWSPQARGKLSRDWDYTSIRTETDEAITRLFAKTQEADKKGRRSRRRTRQCTRHPARRWRLPGFWQSRSLPHPSSAPPSSTMSMTRSHRLP